MGTKGRSTLLDVALGLGVLALSLVAAPPPAEASSLTTIDFDDVAAHGGNTAFITDEYAALGVTFVTDDGIVRTGLSGGDPGTWGLEGPNGQQFLGFNGPSYATTIELAQNATIVSIQAARSNGSGAGDSVVLTAYCGTDVADTDTHTFGAINDWGTLSASGACIDSIEIVGAGAGFHPYGLDDLKIQFGTPVPGLVGINFDDVPAQGGNTAFITDEYAALGVTFVTDDGIVRTGLSGGDPGTWGLEGPNGQQFLGFNGPSYATTIELAQNATIVSVQAARSNGSSAGDSVTLTAYCGTDVADTDTHTFGAINDWGTLSASGACIDSIEIVGAGAGFHPYGLDDLKIQFGTPAGGPVGINFDDVPAHGGNTAFITDEYAALGVTFVTDDGIVRTGLSGGDPGTWGLEGPNGQQFLGFNGPSYATTIELAQNATIVSVQAARSNGSSAGNSVTLTAYCGAAVAGTDVHPFGDINDWGTLSVAASCIDSVEIVGAGAGFHPYGLDDLHIQFEPDTIAPSLTATTSPAPNGAGWHNADVTVSWTCTDDGSGVDAAASDLADDVLTESGDAEATCTDGAGNVTNELVAVQIDKIAPTVVVLGVTDGATYVEGYDVPEAGCDTTDAGSGVATAAALSTSGGPTGEITATCSGAVDVADNPGPTVAATYTVQTPEEGLDAAIDDALAGESPGTIRSFKEKAEAIADAPNDEAKAGRLRAFIRHVEAERGRRLTDEEADELIALAELI